jgi:hypothetical protein
MDLRGLSPLDENALSLTVKNVVAFGPASGYPGSNPTLTCRIWELCFLAVSTALAAVGRIASPAGITPKILFWMSRVSRAVLAESNFLFAFIFSLLSKTSRCLWARPICYKDDGGLRADGQMKMRKHLLIGFAGRRN